MNDRSHDVLADLAALYALDCLVGPEREEFEVHLDSCPECQADVASFRDVAVQLIDEDVPPPAQLRESVLSQLDGIVQQRSGTPEVTDLPAPGARITDIGSATTGRRRADGPVAEVRSPDRPSATSDSRGPIPISRHRRFGGRMVAGAAAVAVAATIAVFAVVERPWEPDDPAQQIVASDDAQHFDAVLAAAGDVDVVVSPEHGRAVMLGEGLEAPPEGHVYQAWWLHGEEKVSAGTFTADTFDGDPHLLNGSPEGADGVALTIEPVGGSDQPTTGPTYIVELS